MSNPSAWKRYISAVGGKPAPEFARFAARYNVATSIEGLQIVGFSDATQEAYNAAMQAALAYSALEALNKALSDKRGTRHLPDPALAKNYRASSSTKLREFLMASVDNKALIGRLASLASDEANDDVLPVAEGIRHLMFHGDFTAHGAGAAQSKATRGFISSLADAILVRANSNFELYLDREALGAWQVTRLAKCPSCKVTQGELHTGACEIGLCHTHGERRSDCMGDGKHAATRYWGVYPGTIEALKRGWTVKQGKQVLPDINRVMVELEWDPATESHQSK
jgi:hypothetical protein